MATQVKTEVAAKVIAASAKLSPMAKEYTQATGEHTQRKVTMAAALVAECNRLGLEKSDGRKMLAASFAVGLNVPKDASEELTAVYLKPWQSDISRVMTLAYPEAPEELKLALAHNKAAKNAYERIGEVKLLDIARNRMSFADTLAGKVATRGGRPDGNQSNGKLNPDARKGFVEAVTNAVAGYVSSEKGRVSFAEARKIVEEIIAKRESSAK